MSDRPIFNAIEALYGVLQVADDFWPSDRTAIFDAINALKRYEMREFPHLKGNQ